MGADEATQTESPEAPSVYVYGVVRGGALREVPAAGIRDAGVELLEREGLAVLVSSLPAERLRVRRQDLLRHLRLLEAVFAETTVAPCSFGTVMESREAVEAYLLGERRDELLELLERLEGRLQLNVKIGYDESHMLKEIVAADPEIARLSETTRRLGDAAYYENIRLGELVATALAERRAADAERFLDLLGGHAEEVVVDEPRRENAVLKASFLVAEDELDAFNEELERLAAESAPRLQIESIGPLPPTAFATLSMEA